MRKNSRGNKKQKEWILKNVCMPSALIETTISKLQLDLLRCAYEYLTWTCDEKGAVPVPTLTGPELIKDIRVFLASYARRIDACLSACDGIQTEDLELYYGNYSGGIDAALDEKSLNDQLSAIAQRNELIEALKKIADMQGSERDEWDAVERVMPKITEIAIQAIDKALGRTA